MKKLITILLCIYMLLGFADKAQAQDQINPLMIEKYGAQYEEILIKADGDPEMLKQAENEHVKMQVFLDQIYKNPLFLEQTVQIDNFTDSPFVDRVEQEPNDFFDTADNIDDVLAMPGVLAPEYSGRLITGSLSSELDIDVYEFTVDTTRMYYFGGLHGTGLDGEPDRVSARLFHESDLDTTFVEGFLGIEGNDQIRGDILGRNTDGRGGAGLFRITGWTSPVNPETGSKLEGKFYLWVFNDDGDNGNYNMTAYSIPLETFVERKEPDFPFENLLSNAADPDFTLGTDGVLRTYMLYQPDTVKVVNPPLPSQSNSVFDQLLAEGDEDVDLFFLSYKKDHTLVVETVPYFGFYRTNEGNIGPGSSRLTDTRNRIYNPDFTSIIAEDDDGGRERMDGPNNIHSRITLTSEQLAENGLNEDGPLILWAGMWASQTRDPGRNVDNSDPGRGMYKIYAFQYADEPVEFEPNNTPENATQIAARNDLLIDADFSGSSDVDMFRVFMHEHRMYTIFTDNDTVNEDIEVRIYHEFASGPDNQITLSSDLVVENNIDVKRNGNDIVINGFVPDETGAYLIELSSNSSGDYQLGVLDKGEIFFERIKNEPDNTLSEAIQQDPLPIGPGAPTQSGMIFPSGDIDHYQFTTDEEFNITVRNTNEDLINDFPVKITLLDASLNELSTSTSGAIGFTPSTSETFVVRIEAVTDGGVGTYTISGGEPFEEKEPNNTFAQATPIVTGQLYEAALISDDVDYFSVDLKAGSLYSFRSVDNNTGAPLDVEFFDEAGGETLLDDSGWFNNYPGDNFKIANIIPQEDKIFYIKISGNAGDYKLLSRENPKFGELAEKHEPDNSIEEARALGPYLMDGQDKMFVQFNPDSARFFGDLDYFKLNLKAGQKMTAETKPVFGNTSASSDPDLWNRDTDTRLRLFDSEGTELSDDDDGGNSWYSLLTFTATEDGEFYLLVANSRGAGGGDDRSMRRGDYILNVQATFEENEPNDNFTQADENPLPDNGFVGASFTDGTDVDIFGLELEAGRIYHIRTVKENENAEIFAELFLDSDTNTNFLADGSSFNRRYSGNNIKINFIPEVSGTYYLRLTSPDGGENLEYNLYMKSNEIEPLKTSLEPNNTIEQAAALGDHPADGKKYSYMLYDESVEGFHDDLDYYQVTAFAGDTLIAESFPFDEGNLWTRDFDGFMYLFDENGTELASNDDGGQDWHSKITYIAPEDGTYYFLVIGQDAHVPPRNDDANRIRDPARGEYKFSLFKSSSVATSTDEITEIAREFKLEQNYPNPFNPTTNIRYSIDVDTDVRLDVFNLIGQRVATLVNQKQTVGTYIISFDASRLSSGLYFSRLQAGGKVQTQKMMLIK
jgi:hypothetical protein